MVWCEWAVADPDPGLSENPNSSPPLVWAGQIQVWLIRSLHRTYHVVIHVEGEPRLEAHQSTNAAVNNVAALLEWQSRQPRSADQHSSILSCQALGVDFRNQPSCHSGSRLNHPTPHQDQLTPSVHRPLGTMRASSDSVTSRQSRSCLIRCLWLPLLQVTPEHAPMALRLHQAEKVVQVILIPVMGVR